MVEGDRIPNNLLEEIAGTPREPQPLTVFQEANLKWWDTEIERIDTLMIKDREYRLQFKAWERRQFNQ
jgi:hypothetical protein